MPVEWEPTRGVLPAPRARIRAWPHRSLPAGGFVAFIAITASFFAVPLLSVVGTPILWGLLPFLLGALALVWFALRRSAEDGRLTETLTLWEDRVLLVRDAPRGHRQTWEANPHWVRVEIHEKGGPVTDYVTLRGAGREVEFGAFLSPDERRRLHASLLDAFAGLRRSPAEPA